MNDEIPWAYVAMIFIAFVSWVYGRIKEAAEYRRARAAAKRAAQEARHRARPELAPSPYRPSAPVSSAPVPVAPTESEPAAEIEMPKTFRELFEMLQEPPAPVPAPQPAPVPAPAAREEARPAASQSPSPRPGELDRSEITHIFPGADPSTQTAPPLQVERVRRKTSSNLHRILHNRGTLREALILKEILDTPVALQK